MLAWGITEYIRNDSSLCKHAQYHVSGAIEMLYIRYLNYALNPFRVIEGILK